MLGSSLTSIAKAKDTIWSFNIAIENDHRNSGFFPLKMVFFHSYVAVYQRVAQVERVPGNVPHHPAVSPVNLFVLGSRKTVHIGIH